MNEIEFIGTNNEDLKLIVVTRSNDIIIDYAKDTLEDLLEQFNDLYTKLNKHRNEMHRMFTGEMQG